MKVYRHGIIRILSKYLGKQSSSNMIQIRQSILRFFVALELTEEAVYEFGEVGTIAYTVRLMQSTEYSLQKNACGLFTNMSTVTNAFNE